MPQKRIQLQPGYTYHIWTHANGEENLFRSDENYRYFLKKYLHHINPVANTFAYCLMPNHLHLMVRVKSKDELIEFIKNKSIETSQASNITLQGFETLGGLPRIISNQFSHLFNGYTQAFNKKYNRKGSLFTPNFNRKLINSDEYFTRLIAYIHNNPVHHGFTETMNNWPYSSWHAYLVDKMTNINKEVAMQWFGTAENFMAIHRELNFQKSAFLFEN